jgi:hypothetical protein
MELVIMAVILVAFGVASFIFGADSRKFEEALHDTAAPHASI